MNMKSIAIDGPSGAGKSTLARMAARELGFLHVDTGAIYRAVALGVLKQGVDPQDAPGVRRVLDGISVRMEHSDDSQRMFLNDEDVTQEIRLHPVSQAASLVSAHGFVRDYLLEFQRRAADTQNVLMDGRDIGTVVLPRADVKIFLTADAEARAERRRKELIERGQEAEFEAVLQDIRRRDFQDENRAVAPLRQAEDAFLLDTTRLSLSESLSALLAIVREVLGQ